MSDSLTPISDAVAKIPVPDLPDGQTVAIGAGATQHGDAGIVVGVQKDIGKPGGWSVQAVADWWKSKGWSVGGWLTKKSG